MDQDFQIPTIDDPKKKLWQKLNASGSYSKSYDDFNKQFSTPERIDKLYSTLRSTGRYTKTKEDFYGQFFSDDPASNNIGQSKPPTASNKGLSNEQKTQIVSSLRGVGEKKEGLLGSVVAGMNDKDVIKYGVISTPLGKPEVKKLPSAKEIEDEAVKRISHPDNRMILGGDDPIGDITRISRDSNASAIQKPEDVFDVGINSEAAIRNKMAELTQEHYFVNSSDAQAFLKRHIAKQLGGEVDVASMPIDEVEKLLPKENTTTSIAFQRIKKNREINSLLDKMPLEEAAIVARNPDFEGTPMQFMEKYNAKAGNDVAEWLNDTDVIERASLDPSFRKQYQEVKSNWYNHFPQAATTMVAQKIAQKREDKGGNSWWYNNPGAESTDEYVAEMLQSGELNSSEELIYKKYLQPALQRSGVRRMFQDQVIPTPDAVNALNEGLSRGVSDIGKTVRNVTNLVSFGSLRKEGFFERNEEARRRLANEAYSTVMVDAKGSNATAAGIMDLTGYMLPMVFGGAIGKTIGVSENAMHKLMPFLMFEGANQEKAMIDHPDNAKAQVLQTTLATLVDVYLAKFIPTKKISQQLNKLFTKEVAPTITAFTNKEITALTAKEQIADKFKNIAVQGLNFGKEVAKGNTQMAGVMTAFHAAHQAIDEIMGVGDLSFADAVDENIKVFKSNWINSSILSAVGAKGVPPKMNGRIIREVAENPSAFINRTGSEEIKTNILEASILWKEIKELDLTDAQKEKLLVETIRERVLTRKAAETTTPAIKKNFEEQVKEAEKKQEAIVKNEDMAEEHQTFDERAIAIKKAIDEKVLKGMNADIAKAALENPETIDAYLKEVSDQALNRVASEAATPEASMKAARKTYGDEIVDLAIEQFPKEPEPSRVSVVEQVNKPNVVELKKQPNEIIENASEFVEPIQAEETVQLPEFLKANLPKGTKESGFGGKSLNEAIAKSIEAVADAIDKGVVLADAIKQGYIHLREYYQKNAKSFDEKKVKSEFEAFVKNNFAEGNMSGITHEATKETREEFGLGELYEKKYKSDKELFENADQEIAKGYNIEALISKIEKGTAPTDLETVILKKYKASLESQIEKDASNENLNALKRLVKATDIIGSEQGRSFRARQGMELRDDSLAGRFIMEMEVTQVADLTEAQKETVKREFENEQKAESEWKEKYDQLRAEVEFSKQQKATGKKSAKTKESFQKERESIKQSIAEKWKKAANDGTFTAVPIPYAKQLVAIAPDVARLTKSYIEEGVLKLEDVVKAIHSDLKPHISDITEVDVRNIIAGEYNEKQKTKSEISEALFNLRLQAKLQNKLETLLRGENPKTERETIVRNKEIENLRQQIKDFHSEKASSKTGGKSADEIALAALKTRTQKEINKIEEQLRTGDFSPTEKKKPVRLDKEALDIRAKLIEVKKERALRIARLKMANRTAAEKAKDKIANLANIPRTMMASVDFSAPLRQGIIPTIAHPHIAGKAFVEMFRQAASQKNFDRWFIELRESPEFKLMEESGLYVADPHNLHLSAKEEAFMTNIPERIPILGKLIKGSERAYVGYLNKMRVDLFNQGAEALQSDGRTFENSPELYKALASFVNNSTGRGGIGGMEGSAQVLNATFFSPRLIASRINLMNPLYYSKLPKEIRIAAIKDMAKFISFGVTTLVLLALNGAEVELDARSSDFGKARVGDTRYDIWGGFQQYVTFLARLITRTRKSAGAKPKTMTAKDVTLLPAQFLRNKLAPIPSMGWDIVSGKTAIGEEVTLERSVTSHFIPLVIQDSYDAFKKEGPKSLVTTALPATFGIGVQSYVPKESKKKSGKNSQPKRE